MAAISGTVRYAWIGGIEKILYFCVSVVQSVCVFGIKVYSLMGGQACPKSTYIDICSCICTEIVFCIDYVLESILLKIQLALN